MGDRPNAGASKRAWIEYARHLEDKVRELEEAARAVVEAKQKSGPFTAPRALWVAIALLNNVLNQEDSSDG